MTTFERAREYSHGGCEPRPFSYQQEAELGYIQGDTDRKKIDIERACVLYRKELEQAELIIKSINPKGLGLIDIDKSVDKFKQAMMEE